MRDPRRITLRISLSHLPITLRCTRVLFITIDTLRVRWHGLCTFLFIEISDGDILARVTGALGKCDRSQSKPLEIFLNLEVYYSG